MNWKNFILRTLSSQIEHKYNNKIRRKTVIITTSFALLPNEKKILILREHKIPLQNKKSSGYKTHVFYSNFFLHKIKFFLDYNNHISKQF